MQFMIFTNLFKHYKILSKLYIIPLRHKQWPSLNDCETFRFLNIFSYIYIYTQFIAAYNRFDSYKSLVKNYLPQTLPKSYL